MNQNLEQNTTDVTLRLSSNMIGTNEANFPHKLLLNNRQVATLGKVFRKTLDHVKLSKIIYLADFLIDSFDH